MADAAEDKRNQPQDPLIEALRALLGERLSTAQAVREHHGKDASYHAMEAPDAVAFAESTEEVSAIVKLCAQYKRPVIAFGTGTSLEGQVQAAQGGICIDLSNMATILEVNEADLDCRVQAGVTRKTLNTYLRDTGLFFPIDPGADASLGGMAATSASGTNAVRYGTMRENVMGLTVVLADGRVIRTGGRARKSSAGYDLTRLFVGSEGTLGIITEVQLRLYGIPEAMAAAVCSFDTLEGAVDSVILTIQSGIPVARIELLDELQVKAINAYAKLDYPVKPTLFFEFHGTEAWAREQAELVGEITRDYGGANFQWATRQEDRTKLWEARHNAYFACLALKPGSGAWATDVCVPISRLAECILETRKDIDETGVLAPIVGHVGDGNFHLTFVIDPDDPEEMAKAEGVNERMVMRALSMGGTCTGEHGVGTGKMRFLQAEHGDALAVMRQLKVALDPDNIMNPGKILTV
ncbi:FAD-linked oxidase C-terminal domain-containing protein [Pelagibius marinus]|uniref:FAD-linked oxidase C-terminal domain-containing protein n=1 Tax=Pelagibius marinus TaxID=2762760 RepID=UPI001872DA81|nr:FAD-linked oxidase C-terminal domain-containing protein [Pelagibius marinus]